MSDKALNVKTVFGNALEITSPTQRQAYLHQACAGNAELRAEVEDLLQALDQAGSFMRVLTAPRETADHDPAVNEGPGTMIGPYELMEQIGEGGFGLVFVAEQQEPVRRKVALKIIKPGMDSREVIARFEAERQALALMEHPNIARIFDGGTTGSGRPYFVMELVKGIPIIEYCDQQQLTARQRLELFLVVCQAVQHAHGKGIIHRDLKPSNILVAPHDGTPVVKVIDFGIAKAIGQQLTSKKIYTRFTQMIGTPLYMSPEQAEINALDVDIRSDVYSLGVLLYELLTGSTPFDRERFATAAFDEIRRIIREEEPPKPSTRLSTLGASLSKVSEQRQTLPAKLSALVKGDLDWIVMKALEKDRTRRYETASGLAKDVDRFLKDEVVEACPPSAWYRFRKMARRNKAAMTTAALVAATLLLGIVVSAWQAVRATRAEGKAMTERDNAEKARRGEADQRAIAVAAAAEAKTNEGKANRAGDEALRLAEKAQAARKLAEEQRLKADLARQAENAARTIADEERLKALAEKEKAEWGLYASHLASAQREWETDKVPLFDHYLNLSRPEFRGWEHDYLYTLANWHQQKLPGQFLAKKEGIGSGYQLSFSPDDKRLTVAEESKVQVWDLASGKVVLTLKDTGGRVAFSPDGARLASCWHQTDLGNGFPPKNEGGVQVSDAISGKKIFWLLAAESSRLGRVIDNVAFSPDGKLLAGAYFEGVKLWDMKSGDELRTVKHSIASKSKLNTILSNSLIGVTAITFSPDGKMLASVCSRSVKVWDVASGKELMTFEEPPGTNTVRKVVFSADGKRLCVTLDTNDSVKNATVKVYELTTGQEVFTFMRQNAGPLSFTPDGKRFFSARTGTVKVWDLAGGQEVITLRGPAAPVAISHDGRRLASLSPDGIRIGELASSTDCLTLAAHSTARGLAFSPDNKLLAGLSSEYTLKLWEAASGRVVRTFKGHTKLVTSVAFSPDGKQLASSSTDDTVRLWDVATGNEIRIIQADTGPIGRVAFSPDGNYLACVGSRGGARVWELASLKEVLVVKERGQALAFSPDSKSLAIQVADVVKVVDVASGREIMTGNGHTKAVTSVAFSPDGTRLASASEDTTVKVWDLASGKDLMTLTGHTGEVQSVAFSPDGKRLVSGSHDGTAKLWDAATGHEVLTLRGHTNAVGCVTFSPDGKRLASASTDHTIKIWDASKSMKELERK